MLIGRYRLFVCVFVFHTYQRKGGYGDTNKMLICCLFVCLFGIPIREMVDMGIQTKC